MQAPIKNAVEGKITYRKASPDDCEQIFKIWAYGSEKTFGSFTPTEKIKQDFFRLFEERADYSFMVAESENNVVGYISFLPATLNPLKKEFMVECSAYVTNHVNKGKTVLNLLKNGVEELRASKVLHVFGYVSDDNKAINKILNELQWQQIGRIPDNSRNGNNYTNRLLFLKIVS